MTAESHGHRGNLVIILDVQMPGMTGPELQSRLNTLRARRRAPGLSHRADLVLVDDRVCSMQSARSCFVASLLGNAYFSPSCEIASEA